MPKNINAWLASFGVSGWMLFLIRHYGSQVKNFITGAGTDDVVMAFLGAVKSFASKYGATAEEVKQIESVFSQIALRASQDIQKDASK